MFTIKNYVVAESLDEAYEVLGKNRKNQILGGTMWMRMGRKNIHMAIDLSALGLDLIEETEEHIKIGAMCTLRQIETSECLVNYCDGIISKSVAHIVGVQFRNSAMIGGSVYSRFGFSDVLTALLALDTYVVLHKGGVVPLEKFMDMPYEKDIVTHILIKKEKGSACYSTERMSATDLPILTVGVSYVGEEYRIVVGGRPSRARRANEAMAYLSKSQKNGVIGEEHLEKASELAVEELGFAGNMRGSKSYREHIAKVMVRRALSGLEVV